MAATIPTSTLVKMGYHGGMSMGSSSYLLVAPAAFLLGCGLVAMLENDIDQRTDLARRHESLKRDHERMAGELRQLRDQKAQLDARLTRGDARPATARREPLRLRSRATRKRDPIRSSQPSERSWTGAISRGRSRCWQMPWRMAA